MQLRSDNFEDGHSIPPEFAFGKRAAPFALSDNHSPHLAWKDAPSATRSFVITCIDTDVPSRGDDVNKQGRTVPAEIVSSEGSKFDDSSRTRTSSAVAPSDGSADSDASALGLAEAVAAAVADGEGRSVGDGDGDAAGEAQAASRRARLTMSAADRCMWRNAPCDWMVVLVHTPPVTTRAAI